MKMSDKLKKYKQLNEMLNIPELDIYLCATVSQLYQRYESIIKEYLEMKGRYGIKDYINMRIYDGHNPESEIQSYSFELHRLEDKSEVDGFRWCITKILPVPDININKVLPRDVINYIGLQAPDPVGENHEPEFFSLDEEAHFEFYYTKYSDVHAFGKITRKSGFKEKELPGDSLENIIFIDGERKKIGEDDYREMFYFMKKFPEVKKHLFTEFFLKCKPLVENRLTRVTSGLRQADHQV